MGISLASVAVKGLPPDTALSRLGLAPTDKTCDFFEAAIAAHPLPGDALLVTALDCDHRIIEAGSMAGLSAGCLALAGTLPRTARERDA